MQFLCFYLKKIVKLPLVDPPNNNINYNINFMKDSQNTQLSHLKLTSTFQCHPFEHVVQSNSKDTDVINRGSEGTQSSVSQNTSNSSQMNFQLCPTKDTPPGDIFPEGELKNKIEVSMRLSKKIAYVKKGEPKETSNLSKFVFNELMKHLQSLYLTHRLNKHQISLLSLFKNSKGRLSSYPILLKDEFLTDECLKFMQSTYFVHKILSSQRMNLIGKLTSLKFLQRIRKLFIKPFKSWKKIGTEI